VELPADDGDLEDRPALAAGCTIELKPAEQTPLSALRFDRLIQAMTAKRCCSRSPTLEAL
jgi:Aldehyde dehydrogenase family